MIVRSLVLASAVLIAGMAATVTSAAELIVNGGFENTGFGGTSSYYNVGGVGADHAVPGDFGFAVPTNNVDIIKNGVYTPYLAGGGAYNLDLVGYGATGSISQTFDTVAGKTYHVSIQYNENGGGKVAAVNLGIVPLGTLIGSSNWQTFVASFVGSGSPASLAITETVGGNSGGIVLDNILVSGAVPEPASWALMVVGFGLVGSAIRRKAPRSVAA